jgi:hypothetical protein
MIAFFKQLPATEIAMEACSNSHRRDSWLDFIQKTNGFRMRKHSRPRWRISAASRAGFRVGFRYGPAGAGRRTAPVPEQSSFLPRFGVRAPQRGVSGA